MFLLVIIRNAHWHGHQANSHFGYRGVAIVYILLFAFIYHFGKNIGEFMSLGRATWTSFFYFIAAGSVSLYLKEYGIFATTLQLLTTKLMSELHISDSLSFWYVLLSLSFIFPGAWKPMAGPYHGAHVCHPLKFNPCITTAIVLISARKGKKLSAKRTITVTFSMTA